ncbi:class ii aldolase adducin domain-containing protein [Moniliophthora roreri MCA 2997]|uniref:Class ii aldolase adducin domain-containing protein n=1 Tax=Moniliophthora roreri (strain MCA 2997) TaxID=1381753 RepID=V2XFY2_MONRO|nr:class ii aldolase adducin domain-containing protein [Moniliophthora roreri MCA 2997]
MSLGEKLQERLRSRFPVPPTFSDKTEEREYRKFRLAQAFRIFGKRGFDEGPAGHITVRDPIKTDCFWVNPLGIHFKLIQPSDLLLVDHSGNILEESGPYRLLNTAAFMIHSKIHEARPDVICAAHSHSLYGKTFSALGIPLDMISQDSCAFYNDYAVYNAFRGIVFEEDEGLAIAKALGSYKAAILQNHGILVATDSIEASIFFYIQLEKACQVQLLAEATGRKTMKIPDNLAAETFKTIGRTGQFGWFSGSLEFQVLENEEGQRFEFNKA